MVERELEVRFIDQRSMTSESASESAGGLRVQARGVRGSQLGGGRFAEGVSFFGI